MREEKCPCCGKGKVEDDYYRPGWYKCVTCGADADRLIDGFFIR